MMGTTSTFAQLIRSFVVATAAVTGLCAALGFSSTASAHEGYDARSEGFANETPKELTDIGIAERLGEQVDLGLTFKNENGETVPL